MTTILSTLWVKGRVDVALSECFTVDQWLTPKSIPYKKESILSILKSHEIKEGNVIVFVKYGKRNPSHFPEICIAGIIISLVFYRTPEDIQNWIHAIRKHSEKKPDKVLALAMMKPLYLKWGEKIYQCLRKDRYAKQQVKRHFATTTTSMELGKKLSQGCALAVYVGHGRSRGWSGYRGFRWKHLDQFKQIIPIGSLISLSCNSLKHDKQESLPMGIQLIMEGRSCAFLGTWDSVHIIPLRTITKILLELFSASDTIAIGELLSKAHDKILTLNDPFVTENWSKFRLIGSPFQKV